MAPLEAFIWPSEVAIKMDDVKQVKDNLLLINYIAATAAVVCWWSRWIFSLK